MCILTWQMCTCRTYGLYDTSFEFGLRLSSFKSKIQGSKRWNGMVAGVRVNALPQVEFKSFVHKRW